MPTAALSPGNRTRQTVPVGQVRLSGLEPPPGRTRQARLFSFNNPFARATRSAPAPSSSSIRAAWWPTRIWGASGAIKGWDRRNQFLLPDGSPASPHFGWSASKAPLSTRGKRHRTWCSMEQGYPVLLPLRTRPHRGARQCRLRARGPESRAPLQGNRFDRGARGTGEIQWRQTLPSQAGQGLLFMYFASSSRTTIESVSL